MQSVAVKAWGLKSDIALEVIRRLVRTLIRLGKYDQIQPWSDEVVRARLNDQEESTFTARQYLYNLGSVYSYLGNYDVGRQLLRRAKTGGLAGGRALWLVAHCNGQILSASCYLRAQRNPKFDGLGRWRRDVARGKHRY